MSKFLSVCEEIQSALSDSFEYVCDVSLLYNGSQRQRYQVPMVLIHRSAVLAFVNFSVTSENDSETLRTGFRNVLRLLAEKTDLSINTFMLYGFIENDSEGVSKLCSFNIYNDRIVYFDFYDGCNSFVESVLEELSYRRAVFEEDQLEDIAFDVSFLSGSNGDVRKDSEGNCYIKKHGRWFLASDIDPDELFQKAALFGAFGAHKFLEQKRGAGLLYFFSCGFFGAGWLLDCVSILFGIYKDADGKYLLPVSDIKNCLLKMLGGFAVTIGYILLYILIISSVGDLINSALDNTITSNSDSIAEFVE